MSLIAKYVLSWFALMIIAIANGVLRQHTYGKHVSDLVAHQISTGVAVLLTGTFVYFLGKLWPIKSSPQAWKIGAIWLAMTVVFEFGFGHFVAGHSWTHLILDYDLLSGRVWLLFLVWIVAMPVVSYKLAKATA